MNSQIICIMIRFRVWGVGFCGLEFLSLRFGVLSLEFILGLGFRVFGLVWS